MINVFCMPLHAYQSIQLIPAKQKMLVFRKLHTEPWDAPRPMTPGCSWRSRQKKVPLGFTKGWKLQLAS